MKLYIYTFEDGISMKLVDCPLTLGEIGSLERVHGECIPDVVEIKTESER